MKCKKAAAVIAGVIMAMGAATPAFADADAHGAAVGSPGVLSGNVVQIPIHVPINLCGNSINVIGALNPAAGNVCVNA
ncbi:chaplin [Streptomyces sp. NPDC014861]|uniref:chaplin n=1 Tax=Streptomyces sp. NPDC014861 TaxID=3364923 RepID=UPI003700FA66